MVIYYPSQHFSMCGWEPGTCSLWLCPHIHCLEISCLYFLYSSCAEIYSSLCPPIQPCNGNDKSSAHWHVLLMSETQRTIFYLMWVLLKEFKVMLLIYGVQSSVLNISSAWHLWCSCNAHSFFTLCRWVSIQGFFVSLAHCYDMA